MGYITAKVKDWYFKQGIKEWVRVWPVEKEAACAKVWGFGGWQEPKSEVTGG